MGDDFAAYHQLVYTGIYLNESKLNSFQINDYMDTILDLYDSNYVSLDFDLIVSGILKRILEPGPKDLETSSWTTKDTIALNSSPSVSKVVKQIIKNNLSLSYIKYPMDDDKNSSLVILTVTSDKLRKEIPMRILEKILTEFQQYAYFGGKPPKKKSSSKGKESLISSILTTEQVRKFNSDLFQNEFERIIATEIEELNKLPQSATLENSLLKDALGNGLHSDIVDGTQRELSNLRDIMNENIDLAVQRSSKIDTLVDKTDKINVNSNAFKRRTVSLKRKLWWNNVKLKMVFVLLGVFFGYLIFGELCGFPFYSKCFRH